MKNFIHFLPVATALFVSSVYSAQSGNVGINTNNPQQKLHVSGTKNIITANVGSSGIALIAPTVRIDGLNITNNPAVFTAASTLNPYYVNANGEALVVKGETSYSYTAPGSDAITTPVNFTITGNLNYQLSAPLLTSTFTLDRRSMVYISSTISADASTTAGNIINNGRAKSIGAVLQFTSAPAASGLPLNTSYISDATSFTNGATLGSLNNFKLSATTETVLPAGTYTIVLLGGGISGNGDDFRVTFGNGNGDKLNVFVRPL
ncbi:hypothetical protein ASG01_07860 [Chryseobacterium sp. Leaf180]|uniref:hypothetical protein n=1 Tax=Chryseobacterium sp. Leaf180 TaxID=1736289 RepID=UPI0006FBF4B8|nr:hypothetical protein [Chryseobacterium sp. Leaf180]KQR93770.1 hypothetical protein ASG01_07860 [Chryseobacterium sp. Leaf180]